MVPGLDRQQRLAMTRQRSEEDEAMTQKLGHDIVALFAELRTTDVSDALDSMGIMDRQTMAPNMRPLWEGCRFAGLARTVKLFPSNRVLTEVPYDEYDQ